MSEIFIKKSNDIPQLKSEYEMLLSLNGEHCCKVISFDEKEGQLIEERIIPGTTLRKEKSLEKRLEVLGEIFYAIHKPKTEGKTYLDWLAGSKNYCKNNPVGEEWTKRAELGYSICLEMFEKYSERFLLHGDLHHDNILLKEDDTYVMIDPKGVIGPAILDLPRFILNEIETDYEEPATEHVAKVIERMSQQFEYPLEDVQRCFVMETILANIWCMEDGENVNMQQMEIADRILEIL